MTAGFGLERKAALVTGGAGGIGAAVARALMEAGAWVATADVAESGSPEGTIALRADVSRPEGVAEIFHEVRGRLGGLDVLVHAVGITRDAVLWKMTDDAWSDVLRVNLESAFRVLREAAPILRERGGGSVVLVASINGERGKAGQSNYVASKAGLIGLGKTAARELGRYGIRVNVVAPGFVDTPLTARLDPEIRRRAIEETLLGRAGTPEDVASAVLFLASSMAAHVTGQVLRVDGGQLVV